MKQFSLFDPSPPTIATSHTTLSAPFYATIPMTVEEKKESCKTAGKQCQAVLAFFRSLPDSRFTTVQVSDSLGMNLNSARRSVTNLQQEGYLEKTDETRIEKFGKSNFLYKLAK